MTVEPERIAAARRAAFAAVMLAVAVVLTAMWVMAAGFEAAGWLLCGEGVALVTTAMLIRAELRPGQRHAVK